MTSAQTKPMGVQTCEVCGNWTEEPCTREEAVADFGMKVVEVDGEDMLLCEWCL